MSILINKKSSKLNKKTKKSKNLINKKFPKLNEKIKRKKIICYFVYCFIRDKKFLKSS